MKNKTKELKLYQVGIGGLGDEITMNKNKKYIFLNIKNLSISFFENQMECISKRQLLARASILIKNDFTYQGKSDLSEKLSY